jgi:histidine ammonia-lyase
VQPLELTGHDLSLDDVVAVARDGRRVSISPAAVERMRAARAVAEHAAAADAGVYGLNTGLGALRDVPQGAAEVYNRLTIQSHRTTHGPLLGRDVVRAAMLHRANALCLGRSMARPEVAEALASALNDGAEPPIRAIGSIGQSDLPVTAEIAHALVERGLVLEQGESLPLLNANSLSAGAGALALHDAGVLLDAYDSVVALSLDGFAANLSMLHPQLAADRPYPGLIATADRLRGLLAGSRLLDGEPPRQLQDPLCFRCIPQVHGAVRDVLANSSEQARIELNASGDNPMVVVDENIVVSVANFDIVPLAMALDAARLALAQVFTASNERVQKLLAGQFSGLATALRADDGPEDALGMMGLGAAALAAEARLLAAPVSLEVSTTTIAAGIEDRMTMAPLAARRLSEMVELGSRVAAVELVVGAQAVDLRARPAIGVGSAAAYAGTRARVPFLGPMEAPGNNLDDLSAWVIGGMPAS